jgi:homoserine dehydrogenase
MSLPHLEAEIPPPAAPGAVADPLARRLRVLKFGSSVLATPEDMATLVSEVYAHVRRGRKVVAVVSALAGETDRLLREARALGLPHETGWLPAHVVQGEARSSLLAALACDRVGLDAAVLTVRELGLRGEGPACELHPVALDGSALRDALARHEVVIVPGFGALDGRGRVGLLGRGGSDMTAVFLAAELGLDRVTLVKDVDGLYDRDPAEDPQHARRYDRACWSTARAVGREVIQPQAIGLAEARGLEIEIVAAGGRPGTIIGRSATAPRPPARRRRTRLAVAGCGVVGGGLLARLLSDDRFEVSGVLVRDPAKSRDEATPTGLLTDDPRRLLAERPDILLEAVSDGAAGEALIRAALEAGVHVVTANKQALARDPAGLQALAAARGARLAFSATVGGGAPMIETIRAAREAGEISGFEAVLNGTVNFILSELDRGADFDAALAAARRAGFAEADASADLEALDAAAKLRLLAFEAFGEAPALLSIPRPALDAAGARRGVRQIAICRRTAAGVRGEIIYRDVSDDPELLDLTGERNLLRVLTPDGACWSCRGRGAGRWATVEAMLADVRDCLMAP